MLLIDIGNSRIKAGVLSGRGIRMLKPCEWRKVNAADAWRGVLGGLAEPDRVLVSNVAGNAIAMALNQWLQQRWKLAAEFVTVRRECAGVRTLYDRPGQLGVDRWLAALAGFRLARGAACVIDAGTALTVDVITGRGEHIGGMIAPGLGLMARSLTQGTAQLSLDQVQVIDDFATNTAGAISLGCREALAGLILRKAERCRARLEEAPTWFVTGGEASVLLDLSPVPMREVPDLVLQGIALVAEADT